MRSLLSSQPAPSPLSLSRALPAAPPKHEDQDAILAAFDLEEMERQFDYLQERARAADALQAAIDAVTLCVRCDGIRRA